ncbi:MAG: FkbM family methyltransferase [Pseudomonadota bacterium]
MNMDAPLSHNDRRLRVLTEALKPSRKLRICDVGANPLSTPPYQGLLNDGAAEVFGFEPHPEAFAKLQAEKSAAETYFPNAVGAAGTRTLYAHPKSGFTSLFPLDGARLNRIGKGHLERKDDIVEHQIETIPLDAVEGLPNFDVLKMDVQGAEKEILDGGTSRLADAMAVVTEVRFYQIYKDEPTFGDLDSTLRAMGFRLYKFLFTKSVMMPHAHEAEVVRKGLTSQLLDGDAVYLRDVDLDGLGDDTLAHLALTADAMADAPDLALSCVDRLIAQGKAPEDLPERYIARFRQHQRAKK